MSPSTTSDPMLDEAEARTPEKGEMSVADNKARVEILTGLARKIEDLFAERSRARIGKEGEWKRSRDLYDNPLSKLGGETVSPDRPFASELHRRRPDINIIRTKCDIAISQSISMQFAAGEKNWDLFPPANTQDPAVIRACSLMEKEIEAQLSASKYGHRARNAMEDRVVLGTGILKGPVNTGRMVTRYKKVGDSGMWAPITESEIIPEVTHVSPWMFYPDHTVNDYAQCADNIELHPMTPIELSLLKDHEGFESSTILDILHNETSRPTKYNELVFSGVFQGSGNPYLYKNRYQVLEYNGPITYDVLEKLGLEPHYENPTNEYWGEVWVCCGKVIRLELENLKGQYQSPYHVAIWKKDPSSIFGFGHPLLMSDAQRVVTQAWHMALDNASLASGPQVAMYQEYLQPADGSWEMTPRKVWKLLDPSIKIQDAIQWFSPPNMVNDILPILQMARQFAEEESGTPLFAAGLGSPGNTESATGALLMSHNSNVVLDAYSEQWDDYITEPLVERFYHWNMQFNVNEEIKGDYVVDVRSSSEYKNKQMYIRDLEKLSVESIQNPAMQNIINQKELQRARLILMHLPNNRIINTDEAIAQLEEAQKSQPNPEMIKLEIEKANAETDRLKVQLQQQQLQFEQTLQQQREQWEHQEKMSANYARLQESQAMVLRSQNEKETEMIKLASKDEQFRLKIQNDQQMVMTNHQTAVFLKTMEEERKNHENLIKDEEIALKKQGKTGI